MAAAQAANMADLLFFEMRLQRVVQFVLRASAQAGAAVADEHLLALILLFQEVIEGNSSERDGIPKQVILPHLVHHIILLSRSRLVGGIDHAFKDVFFDTFAEREGTEIFGHALVGED
jgi:hypothetical protein